MFAPSITKPIPMKNLIQQIVQHADINEDKAKQALLIVTAHVKQQFPLLHSIVDLILETKQTSFSEEKISIPDFSKNQYLYN
jgi:hypothetical protein